MSVLIGFGFWMSWSQFRLETLLGGLITGRTYGVDTWSVGLAWHLLNGGLFALLYQALFHALRRTGAGAGALIGIGHWMVAGFLMPLVYVLRPWLVGPAEFSDLFVWMDWGGTTFFGSIVLHLVYGAIVGAFCEIGSRRQEGLAGSYDPESRAA